jgi:hypothetical protein
MAAAFPRQAGTDDRKPNDDDRRGTIDLDLDDGSSLVRLTRMHDFELRRSTQSTKNRLALVLIIAFACSLPLLFITVACLPNERETFFHLYIHWLTVLASLAGAAIGVRAFH